MAKNEAAAALARQGIKKHPHLHSKEHMAALLKKREEKRKAKKEAENKPPLDKKEVKKKSSLNMEYEP